MKGWIAPLAIGAMGVCLVGCKGCACSETGVVAQLVESRGEVQRDWSVRIEQWTKVSQIEKFAIGDGVRTKASSSALLKLNQGSLLLVKEQTQIRFQTDFSRGDEQKIVVEEGEAEFQLGEAAMDLVTELGVARLEPHSKMTLKRSDEGVVYHVKVGRAEFLREGKDAEVADAGGSLLIRFGSGVLEKLEKTDTEAKGPPAQEDARADEAKAVGEGVSFSGKGAGIVAKDYAEGQDVQLPSIDDEEAGAVEFDTGPDRVDFAVFAGESFVVHAEKPPVGVAFLFGDRCQGPAIVQIGAGKSRTSQGTGKAHVLLQRGQRRYQLRCLDGEGGQPGKVVAQGKVLVVRSSGRSRLPRRAPESVVDADGRKYQIMYQNLLPTVTVRWPKAPQAKAYQLVLSSAGREEKRLSLKAPRHTFASGELKEGTHSGHFEAIGPAVASKTMTVQIQFDNAAPRASIKQPVSGSFVPGQEVTVEGVTEPGWRVFADSKEIESDASHRFSGTVQTSAQYNGMALKLSHEQRGVHYYLRRGQKGSSR